MQESPGRYTRAEVDDPIVGLDDVAVRPMATALNHMDLWVTRGQPRPNLPHVPGCDISGIVDAVGANVIGIAVGDEVVVNPAVSPIEDIVAFGNDSPEGPGFQIVGEHRWGGHADRVVVPARNVVPRPKGRSWEECAAYPLATLTAWRMLRRARLHAAERVLIVGFGGGVSSAATSLALHMGAEVFVTSTSATKRAAAESLGVAGAFASDEGWPVKVDVVVESVGPATWDRSVRALLPGGRLVVCGGTSGPEVTLGLPRLFFKQHEIIGSTMGSYQEFREVTALMARGLPVAVDRALSLDDYPAALERLTEGDQLGKVVLVHDV